MDTFRRLFNKPKKAVENQQMIRPLTSDTKHHDCSDPAVITETLSPANQLLESLLLDIRDLDRDLMSHFKMKDSDPDLLVTTRLTMLRALLQAPQSWTPPSAQVKQLTNERLLLNRCDSISPAGCPDVMDLRVSRDAASLPSSPHPGWRRRRRLPGSLPCSPLLGERRSFPAPPSALSRLLVEAALQRSKNPTRALTPPQVREGGDTPLSVVEIELSDMEGEVEEDYGQWRSESFRYCLLTPCICCRCPSAPPFEDSFTSSSDHQMIHQILTHLGPEHQQTGVDGEQSSHTGKATQPGQSSKLYPSLSLWRITGDSQNEVSGGNTDGLLQLQMSSGEPGEERTLSSADMSVFMQTVFDLSSYRKQTSEPEKMCSFCSLKPSGED